MKKALVTIILGSLLSSVPAFASWTADRTITEVQVADACGSVQGQYAVITDNYNNLYWITSDADNFDNLVAMAQLALVESRTVQFYARFENYTVQTQRTASSCHTGGTIANRVSILKIK
jgi:hypothetical protein